MSLGKWHALGDKSELILTMAAGHEGVNRSRVEAAFNVSDKTASAMLSELTRRGHLHRAKVARLPIHFFLTAPEARAWEDKQTPPTWQLNLARTNNMAPKKAEAEPAQSAGQAATHGIACGFDPRYQCAPGEWPFGAGFAAVGIGRDVRTGKGWVAS